jgi:hypothetical protein
MTYYLAPASFLFNRLDIFFFIINLILIGMILGLGLLCILIFPYIQNGFIHLFLFIFKFDRNLKPLVMKNMNESHSSRNAKTSILFTVCLAYLIFGGSSLLLLGNLIVSFIKSSTGSDMYLSTMVGSKNLPEINLRNYLFEESQKENPLILDYSFGGRSVFAFLQNATGMNFYFRLSNGGDYPKNGVLLRPIEKNYLNSTYIDYYSPKLLQKGIHFPKTQGKKDVITSLYSDEGTTDFEENLDKFNISSKNLTHRNLPLNNKFERTAQIKVVLPEGIKDVLSTKGGGDLRLRIRHSGNVDYYRVLVRGMPRKMPGYLFMSYRQVSFFLGGLISFDQAIDLAQHYIPKSINPTLYSQIQEYQI